MFFEVTGKGAAVGASSCGRVRGMKYIWKLVEGIEDERKQRNMFLAISACVWGMLAFAVSIPVSILVYGTGSVLISAMCAAGYGSILVGIYGGIFFLYRNE